MQIKQQTIATNTEHCYKKTWVHTNTRFVMKQPQQAVTVTKRNAANKLKQETQKNATHKKQN